MIGDHFDFRNERSAFYRARLHDRWHTFQIALNWLTQAQGRIVVETGCLRNDSFQDGHSTVLLGEFCKKIGAKLFSVDIESSHVEVARRLTAELGDTVSVTVGDSVSFLKGFGHRIDLLYLDSFDYDPNNPLPAQNHAREELRAALPRLASRSCVLIDDNDSRGGGKGELAKQLLRENRFVCVLDFFQSCWVRV